MKKKATMILTVLLGIVLTASTFALPSHIDQPYMQAALDDLRDAQNHLKNATADKGGHRQRAMDFTAGAITAVNKGLAYDRSHVSSGPDSLGINATLETLPDQPNMVKAREELQNALANLRKASTDKGGYRNQAIAMTNNAINSVNAGIAYDRNH